MKKNWGEKHEASPCRCDEAWPLQLNALHQQPWLKCPDLHTSRQNGYDVGRLVLCGENKRQQCQMCILLMAGARNYANF